VEAQILDKTPQAAACMIPTVVEEVVREEVSDVATMATKAPIPASGAA